MKYCKDCTFIMPPDHALRMGHRCMKARTDSENMVTGMVTTFMQCHDARVSPELCGPEAKWFTSPPSCNEAPMETP